MPHDEFPDEVADPLMIIRELRGVIIRQRVIIIICLMLALAMGVSCCCAGSLQAGYQRPLNLLLPR